MNRARERWGRLGRWHKRLLALFVADMVVQVPVAFGVFAPGSQAADWWWSICAVFWVVGACWIWAVPID